MITVAPTHNDPNNRYPYSGILGAPTYMETIAALNEHRVRVIGIGQGSGGVSDMEQIARDTGSVDGAGSPLVSTWSGGAIGDAVLDQIQILAQTTTLDISIEFIDDPSDSVDTFSTFVDHLEANTAGDPSRDCAARLADDTNGDGHPDTFRSVTSGNRVCFDIVVKQNDTVEPTAEAQIFRATLRVMGDGFTELDTREIFFFVPGRPIGPG